MDTSDEDLNSKFSSSRDYGFENNNESDNLTPDKVEAWLDKHEDFVASYYSRKATKFLLDAFLRTKQLNRSSSRTSSPLPFGHPSDIGRNQSPLALTSNTSISGCSTPRKSSIDTTSGLLKPLISHLDGIPSFIRFERSLSRPRHRKSKEELKELRLVDEQALLMELATDIANDLDINSLCHKILQNVSILTDGDRCSLFMVQDYGPNGQKILVSKVYDVNADSSVEEVTDKDEIVVPWGCGIVGWVAENGKTLNITDAYSDERFNKDVDKKTGYHTKSILCMPIKESVDEDGNSEVIAVAQVMNKQGATLNHAFTKEDEKIFERYLVFCGIGICNAHLFDQFQKELKRNRVLLDLARAIFEEQSTLHDVVHKIMMNTQSLLQCERCSVLLVDPSSKGLFSKAFDLEARYYIDENGTVERKQSCGSSEVRFPINIGITGTVATTGETLNIPDAYEDPRFDPSVDGGSGFKTRTILCMPIKNSKGDIIGVVQLLNKMDGKPFNQNDENLFEAFAIFCGMAIHNTYIFEECVKANARRKIALDVLSYHATASDLEAVTLVREIVPSSKTFHLREFSFDDATLSDRETCLATIRMFQDLRLIQRFRIDYNVLCNWVLTVRKNYRNVIYHNWRHAFNVAQSMFLFLKELQEFKVNFTDEEKLALLVGCLCHDLDHRGTNNTFQVKSASPLAQLYGTSVMEHHHFDHCIMIIHSSGNEIFNTLSPEEYNLTINVLEHAILSTDLALYFKKRNDYKSMVQTNNFEWEDNSKRSLLRSMLMTSCDISAICKPWPIQQRVAHLVAEEFFQQGDLELRKLNMTPIEMMDRAKKDKLPQMQVGFIDGVCLPIYETLSTHYPYFKPLLDECLNNRTHWKTLANDYLKRVEESKEKEKIKKNNNK